jgi:tRNA(Ile)-lysidine synthase
VKRANGAASVDLSALVGRATFPAPGTTLVCAVSGGADSLALMTLAVHGGLSVTAVHVDHGLREGSGAEAEVVAQAAQRLGAAFRSERVTVEAGANLEARARAARFSVLPPDVATGHTMDDQAETVLSNLLRGSGLDGVAAMRPGSHHPLLGIRRYETHAVCAAIGLVPVRDPSNEDPRYLRNRIRREVLPLLEQVANRDPVPLLARCAALAGDDTEVIEMLIDGVIDDPTDVKALRVAPTALARRAIRRWLLAARSSVLSDHDVFAEQHPPSLAEVDRVLEVARGGAVATELEGGVRVRRTRGRLRVEPPVLTCEGPSKVSAVKTEAAASAPPWAGAAVGPVVVAAEAIAQKVAILGAQITEDYAANPPLLVGVLKGAMMFMSDLCRAIALPLEVDFMAVASYGSSTHTSGVVRIVKDLDADLEGRHVLVVEDIIDSGLTLNYLRRYLQARRPASVEICALLVKEGEQRVDLSLRYVGFTIPSEFVVGYGLDIAERFRNLPSVHLHNEMGPQS